MSELRAQDTSATSGHPPDVTADVFSHRYLAHATSQLPGRPASALSALARDNMSFGATRCAGETLIKISDMDAATTAIDIDDNAEVPAGASTESWMHVEIDAVDEPTAAGLRAALRRVLDDVHHAVTDAPAMYKIVLDLADELQANPGSFDRETSSEAAALLRWLANGAFMILGHAAYSANELASPTRAAAPADPRGVLRGDAVISPLELLPAFRSGA